jgi:hypothetical protein
VREATMALTIITAVTASEIAREMEVDTGFLIEVLNETGYGLSRDGKVWITPCMAVELREGVSALGVDLILALAAALKAGGEEG